DVVLATIAAVVMAAIVAGPNRAGNNRHATQCFGLRDDRVHPGEPRWRLISSTTRVRKANGTANEIKRRWGRRNGGAETAHQLEQGQLGHCNLSDLRASWLYRGALFLELAGGNNWSRALLGWR